MWRLLWWALKTTAGVGLLYLLHEILTGNGQRVSAVEARLDALADNPATTARVLRELDGMRHDIRQHGERLIELEGRLPAIYMAEARLRADNLERIDAAIVRARAQCDRLEAQAALLETKVEGYWKGLERMAEAVKRGGE